MTQRAREVAADVRARKRSAVDVTREALIGIERANASLNAFHHVSVDEALEQGMRIDALVAQGIGGHMPSGVQIIGAPFDDAACLAAARRIEHGLTHTSRTSIES